MHKIALKEGIGLAKITGGECEGYVNEGEEPCDICKDCKLHEDYFFTHDKE